MRKSVMRDLEMLELLSVAQKEIVAQKFGLSMNAFNQWLHRIRERRKEARIYLNKILSLEKRNPRLKKILLSASENDLDLIDDLESL